LSEEDTLITDWKFTYTLSNKCTYENLQNTKAITFLVENNANGDWVTGFVIFIANTNKEHATVLAKNKAKNIAIIISLKVGNPILAEHTGESYKLPGQEPERWRLGKIWRSKYNIFENLDLDITRGNIAGIINQNRSLNERIYHAYLGLRAYQEELYEAVIIQFYQAIEKVLPDTAIKYKPVRDVLSHPEIQYEETIKQLKLNFPSDDFDTRAGSFDYNSPKNDQFIKNRAEELRKIAMEHIRKVLE
jgi:hypothetical protein